MNTARSIIARFALLALTLNILAGALPMLVEMSGGQALQICGSWGVQTITLDENGREIPAAPKASKCPFCTAQSASATPASISQNLLPPSPLDANYVKLSAGWENFLPLHLYEGSPLLSRAPPSYS